MLLLNYNPTLNKFYLILSYINEVATKSKKNPTHTHKLTRTNKQQEISGKKDKAEYIKKYRKRKSVEGSASLSSVFNFLPD